MRTNYTQPSTKIEDAKVIPYLRTVKRSYRKNYDTARSLRQNFILWARDVQDLTYQQIADVFGVTFQRIEAEYKKMKGIRS